MINPVITAAVLVEANGAALNNSGEAIYGARTDNTVSVKSIMVGRERYPYVSGQAWRRWWRETLYEDFSWTPSPVTRESKSAYTEGNPVDFADDDVFGYMAAKKANKDKDGGTQRRVSPLKNSLLISVLPNTIKQDFAHFSRDLPLDNPNMIPFEFEHYTTYLQGVFTLSLKDVGRFELGEMRDLSKDFKSDSIKRNEESGIPVAYISKEEKIKRATDVLKALGQLKHGANLTRNLSDVAPVAIVIGFFDGGNAPFQRIFEPSGDGGLVSINKKRLTVVLSDYKDRTLSVDKPIIIGATPGVIDNIDEELGRDCSKSNPIDNDKNNKKNIYNAGSSVDAIKTAISQLEKIDIWE